MEKQAQVFPGKQAGRNNTDKGGAAAPGCVLAQVEITHPEKVLIAKPGVTKGEIALYYAKVAERMLPYLANRVISVVRCPGGIGKACFYKKHPSESHPGVHAVCVPASGGENEEYFYLSDVRGLMSEVQMNTLEFHTWGSRVEALEHPDIMVFDLDPDEGIALLQVRRAVKDLKTILDQLALPSYLKTSGGKGYHVVVPFKAAAGWAPFNAFAKDVANTMAAMWPDRYTANERKNQRKGRVFIDWMRNGRGATSVAPYSVRAREGAPVSMPIAWRELDTVAPNGITMQQALARLRRKDPWDGFFEAGRQMQ